MQGLPDESGGLLQAEQIVSFTTVASPGLCLGLQDELEGEFSNLGLKASHKLGKGVGLGRLWLRKG